MASPWMSSDILAGIRKRDDLLSRFKRNKADVSLYQDYCKVRNSVQRDIKLAKSNFFLGKVKQSEGDSGKLWGLLKSLGYSSGNRSQRVVLEEGGVKVFDSVKVANIFNRFYTTVAANLVNLLPNASGVYSVASNSFKDFYRGKLGTRDPFILTPVTSPLIRSWWL